jgi:hypothetical protein
MESGEKFVFAQGVSDIRFTSFKFLAEINRNAEYLQYAISAL